MNRRTLAPTRGFSPDPLPEWEPEDDMTDGPTATATTEAAGTTERGGRFGAGWIRQAAIVTRGEALGHELWIDAAFLASVVDAINSTPTGCKSRWSHPNYCHDGLGRAVGRVTDAFLDGDTVRADLHFLDAATRAPEGDLPAYLLDLAEEDPNLFGVSISFRPDTEAETAFLAANSTTGRFVSPDAENANQLPHARLSKLHAADIVDEPAANPAGLFSADQHAKQWPALVAWITGQTDQRPATHLPGIDLSRARTFWRHWTNLNNLTLAPSHPLPEPMTTPQPATDPPSPPSATQDAHAAAAEYRRRWGNPGLIYWADGLSPEAAADAHAAELSAEIARLRAAHTPRGTTPLATAEPAAPPPKPLRGRDKLIAALAAQLPAR